MASDRGTRETHRACNGILLGVAVILLTSGCRSTGGASKMPGMGWIAGSQKSVAESRDEVDPTVNFPAPSSASVPQTLADAERPSAGATHQAVTYNAPSQGAGTVIPANYPTTDYAAIAANGAGKRPEPNPVAAAVTAPANPSGAEYVQNGTYQSPNTAAFPATTTTWGSTTPAAPSNAQNSAPTTGSIYGAGGQTATTTPMESGYAATASDSVYGNPTNTAAIASSAADTTWSPPTPPTGYSIAQGPAAVPGVVEPGTSAGTIAQASYQGLVPNETAPPAQGPASGVRTASAAGATWLPGSTTTYIAR